MNVLLIGLGTTALTALESLISHCHVRGIVRTVDSSDFEDPVISLAKTVGIPIFSDPSPVAIKSLIVQLQPDCVVVSSYDRILSSATIELSNFINVHYSPLPHYRGRANVNWAIINDEPFAAITIHQISPDLDEGNILFQQLVPINCDETVAALYKRLNEIQQQQLGLTVVKAFNGDRGKPQNSTEATYGCTRLPEDGEINWSASTRSIDCLIRALVDPFPGAYTYYQGEKISIWRAQLLEYPPNYIGRIPGRIIGRSPIEGYVDVLTGNGILRIFEVQIEGADKTSAASIIKSVKSTLGLRIADLLDRIRILEQTIIKLQKYEK